MAEPRYRLNTIVDGSAHVATPEGEQIGRVDRHDYTPGKRGTYWLAYPQPDRAPLPGWYPTRAAAAQALVDAPGE